MNQELQHQIFTRLDALAQKLNIVGGQIWQFYMAQARVEVIQDIFLVVICAVISVATFLITRYLYHQAPTPYGDDEGAILFFGFVSILTAAMSLILLYSAFTPWLNPNYWAFQKLISTIMGGH